MHEDKGLGSASLGYLITFYTWEDGQNSKFMNHILKVLDILIVILFNHKTLENGYYYYHHHFIN